MVSSSILTALMKLSIQVNGVFVPFNRAIDSWRRHCQPVLHYIDDIAGLDLGCAGSSFLLNHNGQLLQLFSMHQLKNLGIVPEDVLIYRDELDVDKALGPKEIISPSVDGISISKLNDIKIVRFESQRKLDALAARFFGNDISRMENLESIDLQSVVMIFTVGFPSNNGRIESDYDDVEFEFKNVHLFTAATKIYLQATQRIKKDLDGRIPLEIYDDFEVPNDYDFNGFSGAPVFFIFQDDQKIAHLGFAGMIVEVLFGTRLQLYPGSIIQRILKQI